MNMTREEMQEQLMKMPVIEEASDWPVESYQELLSDRDRLHNIYIAQTIEISKLKQNLTAITNGITYNK